MQQHIVKNGKKLRFGYTTGSCATAASKAAGLLLLSGEQVSKVDITLPGGSTLTIPIKEVYSEGNVATCCVVKDAGDDPDVTHGMDLYVSIALIERGIQFIAGEGIGIVTKPGLALEVGEPAINPVPRQMITNELQKIAAIHGYSGGFSCTVFAPEGTELSKRTFNERLGIIGGLSILGTTGIVEPMSELALIKTIQTEIAQRKGQPILFIAPGNYGLTYGREVWDLDIDTAVKCSNFLGETLDYAIYCGFEKILLLAHGGKLCKVAAGVMNTHSKSADTRGEVYGVHAAINGANRETIKALLKANTTEQMHSIIAEKEGQSILNNTYKTMEERIRFHMDYRVAGKAQIEFIMFSSNHETLIETPGVKGFIKELKEISN